MLPEANKLKPPSSQTLRKYGLSLDEWQSIAIAQNNVCAVCLRLPAKGILCVDHLHVKGFKKMQPEQKKKYLRGLLCRLLQPKTSAKGADTGEVTKNYNLSNFIQRKN